MNALTLQERLIAILADQLSLNPEEIEPSLRLVEDLQIDDLDRVELILELEEQFKIEIPDDESEKFTTVQDVVDCLSQSVPA